MEVELDISVGQVKHIVARVIAQISEMIVSEDFDDDGIGVVAKDLEVALSVCFMPELRGMVSSTCINVTRDDKLAI